MKEYTPVRNRCPSCGIPFHNGHCIGQCGIILTALGNYSRDVGKYRVYWDTNVVPGNNVAECVVWKGEDVIYVGKNLPYDVGIDMIQMLEVFS